MSYEVAKYETAMTKDHLDAKRRGLLQKHGETKALQRKKYTFFRLTHATQSQCHNMIRCILILTSNFIPTPIWMYGFGIYAQF